jgi:hypothetical protein
MELQYSGQVIQINIELSRIDSLIDYVNGTISNKYISILGPIVELWFINLDNNTSELLN